MSGFQDTLDARAMSDGRTWVLLSPFRWRNGRQHEVPALFVTDFASIPRVVPTLLVGLVAWGLQAWFDGPLAWILAALLVAWAGLSPFGSHQWAATIHDWNYWSHTVTRAEADKAFLDGMRDAGTPLLRRWAMYAAVRLFGGFAWWSNERMREQGVNRVLDRLPEKWERLPPTGLERLILVVLGRAKEA